MDNSQAFFVQQVAATGHAYIREVATDALLVQGPEPVAKGFTLLRHYAEGCYYFLEEATGAILVADASMERLFPLVLDPRKTDDGRLVLRPLWLRRWATLEFEAEAKTVLCEGCLERQLGEHMPGSLLVSKAEARFLQQLGRDLPVPLESQAQQAWCVRHGVPLASQLGGLEA